MRDIQWHTAIRELLDHDASIDPFCAVLVGSGRLATGKVLRGLVARAFVFLTAQRDSPEEHLPIGDNGRRL